MARRLVAEATAVAKLDISDVERGVLRIRELLNGVDGKVTLRIDGDLTALKDDLRRVKVEEQAKPPVKVKVGADPTTFKAETAAVKKETEAAPPAKIRTEINAAEVIAKAKTFLAAANIHVNTRVDLDIPGTLTRVAALQTALAAGEKAQRARSEALNKGFGTGVLPRRGLGPLGSLELGSAAADLKALEVRQQFAALPPAELRIDIDEVAVLAKLKATVAALQIEAAQREVKIRVQLDIANALSGKSVLGDLEAARAEMAALDTLGARRLNRIEIPEFSTSTAAIRREVDMMVAELKFEKLRLEHALRELFDIKAIGAGGGLFGPGLAGGLSPARPFAFTRNLEDAERQLRDLEEMRRRIRTATDLLFGEQQRALPPGSQIRTGQGRPAGVANDRLALPQFTEGGARFDQVQADLAKLRAEVEATPDLRVTLDVHAAFTAAVAEINAFKAELSDERVRVTVQPDLDRAQAALRLFQANPENNRLKIHAELEADRAQAKLREVTAQQGLGTFDRFIAEQKAQELDLAVKPKFDEAEAAILAFRLDPSNNELRMRAILKTAEAQAEAKRAAANIDSYLAHPHTLNFKIDLAGALSDFEVFKAEVTAERLNVAVEPDVLRANASLAAFRNDPLNQKLKIQAELDIDRAQAKVKELNARSGLGSFDRFIAEQKAQELELAVRPKFDQAEAAIAAFRNDPTNKDLRIDAVLKVAEAKAEAKLLDAEITKELSDPISVTLDYGKATARTLTFRERLKLALGGDVARIQPELDSAKVEIKATTLRERLGLLLGKVHIGSELDDSGATVKALTLRERLKLTFAKAITQRVNVDVNGDGAKSGVTKILAQLTRGITDLGTGSTTQGANAIIGAAASAAGSGPFGIAVTTIAAMTAALAVNAAAWVAVGVGAAGAGLGVTKFAIEAAQELQAPLIGLSRQLEGTRTDFGKFGGEVADFAVKTPFSLATSIRVNQRLIAQGVDPQKALSLNKLLADAVSASGGTDANFNQINLAVAKIESRGVLNQRLITSLTQNAPGAFNQGKFLLNIAEAVGITGRNEDQIKANVTKAITNREINSEVAVSALTKTLREQQGVVGASAAQVNTFSGALTNLKDSLQVASLVGFSGFFKDAAGALSGADTGDTGIAGSLGAAIAKIGPAVQSAFKDILPAIRPAIAGISDFIASAVRGAGPLIREVGSFLAAAGRELSPGIQSLLTQVGGFFRQNRGFFLDLLTKSQQAAGYFIGFLSTITTGARVIYELVTQLPKAFGAGFQVILGLLQQGVGEILKPLQGVINTFGGDTHFADNIASAGARRRDAGFKSFNEIANDSNTRFDKLVPTPEQFETQKRFSEALNVLKTQFSTGVFGAAANEAVAALDTYDTATVDATDASDTLAAASQAAADAIVKNLETSGTAISGLGAAIGDAFDTATGKIDTGKLAKSFEQNVKDMITQATAVRDLTQGGLVSIAQEVAKLDPAQAAALLKQESLQQLTDLNNALNFGQGVLDLRKAETSDAVDALAAQATIDGQKIGAAGRAGIDAGVGDGNIFHRGFNQTTGATPLPKTFTSISATDNAAGMDPAERARANLRDLDKAASEFAAKQVSIPLFGSPTAIDAAQAKFQSAKEDYLRFVDAVNKNPIKPKVEAPLPTRFERTGVNLFGFGLPGTKPSTQSQPSTTVKVTADSSAAQTTVTQFTTKTQAQPINVKVTADTSPAIGQITNLTSLFGGAGITVGLGLNTSAAVSAYVSFRNLLNQPINIPVTINGKPATPAQISGVDNKTQTGRPSVDSKLGGGRPMQPQFFAKGGNFFGGQTIMTGEQGREIATMAFPGEVLNNQTTERLVSILADHGHIVPGAPGGPGGRGGSGGRGGNATIDAERLGAAIGRNLAPPVTVHPPYGDPDAIASAVLARIKTKDRSPA